MTKKHANFMPGWVSPSLQPPEKVDGAATPKEETVSSFLPEEPDLSSYFTTEEDSEPLVDCSRCYSSPNIHNAVKILHPEGTFEFVCSSCWPALDKAKDRVKRQGITPEDSEWDLF